MCWIMVIIATNLEKLMYEKHWKHKMCRTKRVVKTETFWILQNGTILLWHMDTTPQELLTAIIFTFVT